MGWHLALLRILGVLELMRPSRAKGESLVLIGEMKIRLDSILERHDPTRTPASGADPTIAWS